MADAQTEAATIQAATKRETADREWAVGANGEIRRGDLVLSVPEDEYGCLVGEVLAINKAGSPEHAQETDNLTDDIHVDFMTMDYSKARQREIAAMFTELYDEPKVFSECPIDDTIMAPDSLVRITGIADDRLSEVLASEKAAAAYCREVMGQAESQAANKDGEMSVLIVEPGKSPRMALIQDGLDMLRSIVGGTIQAVYPFEDEVALVCNDEGKLNGLPLNRALHDENGDVYDIIAGSFIVCGLGEEDFASLTPELAEKYHGVFRDPEEFIRLAGKILPIKHPTVEPGTDVPKRGGEPSL